MKWLFIYILVIINPYKDIRYGEIESYDYQQYNYQIEVTKPEEEQVDIKNKEIVPSRFYCSFCVPPEWIYEF